MRVLISILFLLFICTKAYCQIPVRADDDELIKDDSSEEGPFSYAYELAYSKAVGLYEKGLYVKAETYFRKAFKIFPNDYAAEYIYYTLVYQGRDLEAGLFWRKHRDKMGDVPAVKIGVEYIYLDLGLRVAASSIAGNLSYNNLGAMMRLGARTRLWMAASYLQQDNDINGFKQYEYFATVPVAMNKGWSFVPSVHYANTPFQSATTESKPVTYDTTVYLSHRDTIYYHTKATQDLNYTIPGKAHYLNVSLSLSKRVRAFIFEAEPSFHYSTSASHVAFVYKSTGTTDSSFSNNGLKGSKPFTGSGSGSYDTTVVRYTGQIGASVSYRLPIKQESVSVKLAGYYLFDNEHSSCFAWYFYSLVQLNKNYWLHVNCLSKGSLPFALNNEGLYFNFSHEINLRAGVSLQFRPLKRFSPVISYQFEQDERFEDEAVINYHSCYITLKYRL